jgi:hypothetical protein
MAVTNGIGFIIMSYKMKIKRRQSTIMEVEVTEQEINDGN